MCGIDVLFRNASDERIHRRSLMCRATWVLYVHVEIATHALGIPLSKDQYSIMVSLFYSLSTWKIKSPETNKLEMVHFHNVLHMVNFYEEFRGCETMLVLYGRSHIKVDFQACYSSYTINTTIGLCFDRR